MTRTPLKAIRAKRLECTGRPKDIRLCPSLECPLHLYRMGKNPNRKGIGNLKPSFCAKNASQQDVL